MNTRRILLVVDTPRRDLESLAIVSYWLLQRHQIKPVLVGTRNEVAGLILHKPSVVVLPHVRYERNEDLLRYAKNQGTGIAVLPTEGLQALAAIGPGVTIGREEYRSYIDLYCSWGNLIANRCKNENLVPNAKVLITGNPRFDFLNKRFDSVMTSRQRFCDALSFDSKQPIITWFSNMAYANAPETDLVLLKRRRQDPTSSFFHLQGALDLEAVWRDDQKMFRYMIDLFSKLARENPQWNFVAKPHPLENRQSYEQMLRDIPNVRIVNGQMPLADVIRHADIQLNWRCTTAAEGWMHHFQKATLTTAVEGLETQMALREIIDGNDPVNGYDEAIARIQHYLTGGDTRADLLENRRRFLEEHVMPHDGQAGEKVASAIAELAQARYPSYTASNVRYVFRRYLPHVLRHRRLVYESRGTADPKYLDKRKVAETFKVLNTINQTNISSDEVALVA